MTDNVGACKIEFGETLAKRELDASPDEQMDDTGILMAQIIAVG